MATGSRQYQKATRQHTKEHNQRLVLKTIFAHENGISRADIARLTHLTRATVSEIVGELLDDGLVAELGVAPSPGGKPPILVGVVPNSRLILSVDVSNDEYRGALVNLRGEIVLEITRPAAHLQGEEAVQAAYHLTDELRSKATSPILGIGISTPGLVDPKEGVVYQAVNRGWVNVPLQRLFADRYHMPVFVANDSHMLALAESSFGAGKDLVNLVAVKVGEGIGTGIVLGRQLFSGDGFGAGEIGHLVVKENGALCTCGNRGCLETVASVRALEQRVQEAVQQAPDSLLASLVTSAGKAGIAQLAEAVRQSDPVALEITREVSRYLGVALAALIGVLNIHHIFLYGPIRQLGSVLLEAVHAEVQQRVLKRMANATRITFSALGEDASLLGASALVLSRVLGLP